MLLPYCKHLSIALLATSLLACGDDDNDSNSARSLELLGRYSTGVFDESAAEIAAFDKTSQRLFVVNGDSRGIDVLDISDPSSPTKVAALDLSAIGKAANSVAVAKGVVAVAVEVVDGDDSSQQLNGKVAFYQASDLSLLNTVDAGALPDMVTFTPDGNMLLVANEGEPNDDYSVDPEGSLTIVDLSNGVTSASVSQLSFNDFDADKAELQAAGVRIFGPNATVSQDLEPEYIAVSADSKTAWVALQENNALAIVDIEVGEISELVPLGVKKHSQMGNELDASDKDDAINIKNWPVQGMYQPDAISAFEVAGETYIATANEGDSRDYDGYSEEARVKDLVLNPIVFAPDEAELQKDENLGRLKTTLATGDFDADGQHDRIYSYGARSFSIWNAQGELVWDSGSEFEDMLSSLYPDNFNASNDKNSKENRSDDKGVEPEAITTAAIGENVYAFIGLERFGGIMVYNISNPKAPVFESFRLDRDFSRDPEDELAEVGDLGPEGILAIPAADSPNGQNLLVVSSEVSGTVTLYRIR